MWTYFVQSVEGGPIKIGITSRPPEERLRGLQTGSPTKLRIVGLLPVNQEKELHRRFVKHHSHGEWFHPAKELLEFIATEASSHLQEQLASDAKLQLEETTVPVKSVSRPEVSASFFDVVFDNDENLYDLLIGYYDWNEGEDFGEEELDDLEEIESVCSSISSIALECETESTFIEGVGVNADAGLIGIICGPCNSRRRFEVLCTLGDHASDIDDFTGKWFIFAVFWDRGKQIGIDLRRLAVTGTKDNLHIFDPATAFVCEPGDDFYREGVFDDRRTMGSGGEVLLQESRVQAAISGRGSVT